MVIVSIRALEIEFSNTFMWDGSGAPPVWATLIVRDFGLEVQTGLTFTVSGLVFTNSLAGDAWVIIVNNFMYYDNAEWNITNLDIVKKKRKKK